MKREDAYNRLVYLLKERGFKFRDIQNDVINKIYRSLERPLLKVGGQPEKPHFLAMKRMYEAGKKTKSLRANEWATKMIPIILDEHNKIRCQFNLIVSVGAHPTKTNDIARVILDDAENGLRISPDSEGTDEKADSERTDEEKAS